MKHPAFLLLLAAGGCTSSAPADPAPTQEQDGAIVCALAYDCGQVRVGQRVLYRLTRAGVAEPKYVKLQATAAEQDATFWVELTVPAEPRPFIVKSRLDRAGRLCEQWQGEGGSKGPAKTYPTGTGTAPAKPADNTRADAVVTDETITVGGREWVCKKVATKLTYPDGRTRTMITWCHADVPFTNTVGSASYGGVVKRVYGMFTLELTDYGQTGARAELEIPKK
jgi:hypothetical protein